MKPSRPSCLHCYSFQLSQHSIFVAMQESSEAGATQAEATLKETREAAEAAAARATADYDSLRRVLDAVNAQKAELDSRLAKAGGALNAAEELREAK